MPRLSCPAQGEVASVGGSLSLPVILITVVTFSVVVNRLLRRFSRRLPDLTGVEYLVLGVAVGPFGAGLLDHDAMESLQPVVSLSLGLLGFILGLPLRHRIGKASTVEVGLLASLATAGTVFGASYALLELLITPGAPDNQNLWLSLAIGAAAAAVAGPALEAGIAKLGSSGHATETLRSHAVMGNVVAVAVAGAALAVARSRLAADQLSLSETEWLFTSAGLGIACGIIFAIFLGARKGEGADRTFLATVGVVIFASGMAAAIGVSPLLLNAMAGVTVSMLYRDADRLYETLGALRAPVSTVVLIFAGAMWRPASGLFWLLPIAYFWSRYGGLRLSTAVALRLVPEVQVVPRLGNGALAQGALAAAVAVNFAQVNPSLAPAVLSAVLPAILVTDAMGPFALRETLADAGEVGRVAEASVEEGGGSTP